MRTREIPDDVLKAAEERGIDPDRVIGFTEVHELRVGGESYDPYRGRRDVEILVHEMHVDYLLKSPFGGQTQTFVMPWPTPRESPSAP